MLFKTPKRMNKLQIKEDNCCEDAFYYSGSQEDCDCGQWGRACLQQAGNKKTI
jgi:hypothetical protein